MAIQLNQLVGVVVVFVAVVLVGAFSLQILGDVSSDFTTDSAEYNATQSGVHSIGNITGKMPLVATILIAVLVISLLIGGFMSLNNRR